ncbi:hypothetical protein CSC33_3497 [Pseudomonas aeruginosa]|nr:hypothetical protein CSC33_3497 [Pseudomonas aeruginosa]
MRIRPDSRYARRERGHAKGFGKVKSKHAFSERKSKTPGHR